ncbi:MAG: AAA family ATPase [Steroidobacteraceae bacterium]
MQIKSISRIRQHRIFQDFTWPVSLPLFARLNLIYGWNGSGKSTLSNLFRCLEQRSPIADGDVTFNIDGTSLRGVDVGPAAAIPKVRVFNRAFVEDNVFSAGGVRPIFYIGKESKEKQQEVLTLNARLAGPGGLVETSRKASDATRSADRDLDSFCQTQAQKIKETLRSPGSDNLYNNFNKANYRTEAEAMTLLDAASVASHCLSEKQKNAHTAKIKATRREPIVWTPPTLQDPEKDKSSVEALLARKVTSAAIPAIAADPQLETWVREGLPLHNVPRTSGTTPSDACRFCGEPLTSKRVAELEGHFNQEYERLASDIENAVNSIRDAKKQLEAVSIPVPSEIGEHLQADFKAHRTATLKELQAAIALLDALLKALAAKNKKPFVALTLSSYTEHLEPHHFSKIAELIGAITAAVETNNNECAAFDAIVKESREALAQSAIAESLQDFSAKTKTLAEASATETSTNDQIAETRARIAELERVIVEHHQAAEELNDELSRYLGRKELTFSVQGTGYAITRGGVTAANLSEGEKTAIAFLYFLKSLGDRSFDLTNDVVVIDDPVSSLDANSLFCAFGYLKERTKDAGQLFILTHSFPLFCQIRNWFGHENGGRKKKVPPVAHFYMLDCEHTATGRNSRIAPLDDLLEQFDSEYHYLFKKVQDGSALAAGAPLETYYSLPNIARRLLESFLSFRFPAETGGLYQRMSRLTCEPAVRSRVLRFVHTYSHEGVVGEEHDPTLLAETPGVLRDVLSLIEEEDPTHFKGMVDAVA